MAMERYQRTTQNLVHLTGVGLHSGKPVKLTIAPAPQNHGITFRRVDIPSALPISARSHNVSNTDLSTRIGQGPNSVSTIEHLMAAFFGLGIDNAEVLLDGPEVPIMDGSSLPFVEALQKVGRRKQAAIRKVLVAKAPFEVRDGDRWMRVDPSHQLSLECHIHYQSQAIGKQHLVMNFSRDAFLDLCNSRTFCHVREVDAMRAAGLALGGSLENAVVVSDHSVLNEEGLRSANEFVRHKVLDAIGDLALLGAPLMGRITMHKNGHGLHVQFMNELWQHRDELVVEMEGREWVEQKLPAMSESLQTVAAASAIFA